MLSLDISYFANSVDPDQWTSPEAPDQDPHFNPTVKIGIQRLNWLGN